MADLTAQTVGVTGTVLTAVAPTATIGDWVPLGSTVTVRNASGSPITVTVVVPGNDPYGTARPDFTATVAAGAARAFKLVPSELGDSSHSNMVNVICSAVASVTLEVTN